MVEEPTQTLGRHRNLADSETSDDGEPGATVTLTAAKAADLCPKPYRLLASHQNVSALHDLAALPQLDYIDLSRNHLRSLAALSSSLRLKTLNVSSNAIADVTPILKLSSLRVLNISHNPLPSLDWLPHAAFVANLVSLIASNNNLRNLDGALALHSVKTLVVSQNAIEDLSVLACLPSLVKLSASYNAVREIPPAFVKLHNLVELRLAHNRLTTLPPRDVARRMPALRILDVGANRLREIDPLVGFAASLRSVSLRGNPVCDVAGDVAIDTDAVADADEDSCAAADAAAAAVDERVRALCPHVEIIDGRRVAGGRRKLRINRLRIAAGMSVEHGRQFARAPPAPHLARLLGADGVGDPAAEPGAAGGEPQVGPSGLVLDPAARREAVRAIERETARKLPQDSGPPDERVFVAAADAPGGGESALAERARWYEQMDKNKVDSAEATDRPAEAPRKRKRGADVAQPTASSVQGRHPRTRGEQGSRSGGEDDGSDDDDAIGAEEFINLAREANLHQAAGAKTVKAKVLRKERKRKRVARVNATSFGAGGVSQW